MSANLKQGWNVSGTTPEPGRRPGALPVYFLALLAFWISPAQGAEWYLHADQALSSNWHTLADWWSTPLDSDTSGTHPASINPSDTFHTNGHQLRTPAGTAAETFGGGTLVLDGGNVLIKDISTTTATAIPNLAARGGASKSVTTGANGVQLISLGALTLAKSETTVFTTGSSARHQDLAVGTLQGNGTLKLKGGGTTYLGLGSATGFYGRIHLVGSSKLEFKNGFSTPGSLVIESGSQVNLNQNITVSGLRLGGTTDGAGEENGYTELAPDTTYTFAALNAAYPSIFPGGSGSITVTRPAIVADASSVIRTVPRGLGGACASSMFWNSLSPDYRGHLVKANMGIVRIVGYPSQTGAGTLEELDTKVAQILNAGAIPLFIQCIDSPSHNPTFYNALYDANGNLGTGGTVGTNMAFLAKHFKAPPFNLETQYWEVGNEPDIAVSYKVASTAEYIGYFQDAHNQLIAAGVRGNVKLCGPVISFEVGYNASNGWADGILNDFLAACGTPLNGYNQVDVVTRHVYPYIYSWEATPAVAYTAYNLLNAACEQVTFTQARTEVFPNRGEGVLQAKMRNAGLPSWVGTGVTEMNVGSTFAHTITQGLWFLTYNHFALYNPRSELGTGFVYDSTSNPSAFFNSAKERSYSYWAAYIHGMLTGDQVLAQESSSSHLLASATRDPYSVFLQVVNRNSTDMTASVALNNAPVSGNPTLFRLSSSQTPETGSPAALGTSFSYTFPAMTSTIFRYDRIDAPPPPPGPPAPPAGVLLDTAFDTAPSGMLTYYTGWQPTVTGGDLRVTSTTANMAGAVVFNGHPLAAAKDRAQIRFGFRVNQNYAEGFVFGAYSSNPGAVGYGGGSLGYYGQSNRLWGVKVDNNPDQVAIVASQADSMVEGWCTQPLSNYSARELYMVIDYEGTQGTVRARMYEGTDDTGTLLADITNSVGNPAELAAGTVFGFTGSTGSFSQDTIIHDLKILTGNTVIPSYAFVTGQTLSGSVQNNYNGWLGFRFTVGSSPLTVSELGRWIRSGNTGTHTVKLVDAATGLDVPGGSVSIATSGAPAGTFRYAPLAQPVVLPANGAYYLVSQEPSGGDYYYTYSTVLQHAANATITSSAFGPGSASGWRTYSTAGHSYVPVSFKYQ
jgi:hypothetical protein